MSATSADTGARRRGTIENPFAFRPKRRGCSAWRFDGSSAARLNAAGRQAERVGFTRRCEQRVSAVAAVRWISRRAVSDAAALRLGEAGGLGSSGLRGCGRALLLRAWSAWESAGRSRSRCRQCRAHLRRGCDHRGVWCFRLSIPRDAASRRRTTDTEGPPRTSALRPKRRSRVSDSSSRS